MDVAQNVSQKRQCDRCPTLAPCPVTSFFFWGGGQIVVVVVVSFGAGQKVKYWAYSSSSFRTCSFLFAAFPARGSDGVTASASGRLREGREKKAR